MLDEHRQQDDKRQIANDMGRPLLMKKEHVAVIIANQLAGMGPWSCVMQGEEARKQQRIMIPEGQLDVFIGERRKEKSQRGLNHTIKKKQGNLFSGRFLYQLPIESQTR